MEERKGGLVASLQPLPLGRHTHSLNPDEEGGGFESSHRSQQLGLDPTKLVSKCHEITQRITANIATERSQGPKARLCCNIKFFLN